MSTRKVATTLRQKWPWLAALAPVLALGADNLVGKGLSGQVAQRAIQAAVQPLIDPVVEKMGARFDKIERKIDRRCGDRHREDE